MSVDVVCSVDPESFIDQVYLNVGSDYTEAEVADDFGIALLMGTCRVCPSHA